MPNLIRINDEVISTESFVNLLKLSGRFDSLIDDIVKEKLAVHSAKRIGIKLDPEIVQKRSDQIRRVNGLHRAVEMNRYLESMKVTPKEYETYITDMLCYETVMDRIVTEDAVEKYFKLNSPKFDSIDVSHIVVDSEGKAKEIMAALQDEPDRFAELAHEYSIADTRNDGGTSAAYYAARCRGTSSRRCSMRSKARSSDRSFGRCHVFRDFHGQREEIGRARCGYQGGDSPRTEGTVAGGAGGGTSARGHVTTQT